MPKDKNIEMMRKKIAILFSTPEEFFQQQVKVAGWVRTLRKQKKFTFLELNDGSCLKNLQLIVDESNPAFQQLETLTTGSSIGCIGKIVPSPGKNQSIEMQVENITIYGLCPEDYPLQKKRHSFEYLRSIAHLRPRSNTQGAVVRIRNHLAYATHQFFQELGFYYIQTPIITASDCEGGGEMFQVTTIELEDLKNVEKIDYTQDFFHKPAYLTVSGQLSAEVFACALSDVYTFGPTFRAENSHTSRHLAEFWMIEPEMAFADLSDNMQNASQYLHYLTRYLLKHAEEDLRFFDQFIEKGLLERLHHVEKSSFAHLTYSEAIAILEKSNHPFEFPCSWGHDLQSEHERYLCEVYLKQPVIITDYPKAIKAFYMRDNDDGKTVAAMDVLVPKVGEIIGGSQREERLPILEEKIHHMGLPEENYYWYTELRKYGSVPHAGYGVGFERLVQYFTGMENIRDVIPFPRYPGSIAF